MQQLFGEVFPIGVEMLPPLTAYHPVFNGDEPTRRAGTKLAAWFGGAFGGFWVWSSGRLITDAPPNPVKLIMALDSARADQPKNFQLVETIEEDFHWQPTPEEIADYVVHGPVSQIEEAILEALSRTVYTIRSTRVQREYRLRPWTVGGAPALSVSVVSRLLYEPDLQAYLETLDAPSGIVGLWVADKTSRLQGEVVKLVGLLDEHRDRLIELSQRADMRQIIADAPGDHWVARVLAGSREYDYVTDALDLVIRPEDIDQFAINRQQMEKALHLKPAMHAQMIKLVSDILKDAGLITNAYSTQNAPELFRSDAPQANLMFGNNRVRPYRPDKLDADFQESGAYRSRASADPLRVVVINTLSDEVDLFLEALKRSLEREYQLTLEIVRERNIRVISQANLESAVRLLQKETSEVVLVFLPDEVDTMGEEGISAHHTRAQTIGRGLSCFVIHESTLNQPEAMTRIIMGLLARTDSVPYMLADPLPYTDRIVGLSLIYHNKREGEFLTGMTRIYGSDGAFLRAAIAGTFVGEGIPDSLLAQLFPRDLLREKRILIHSDGHLRRDMQRALGSCEDELDAVFYPVEVIRAGVPRMYAFNDGKIDPPSWGSIFRLSDTEAFVQSSQTTLQPLYLRCEPPLTIEEAAHSVLMFTLFHYGAITSPKLPVTTHNTDPIETGILRGIMPSELVTEHPFFL